MFLSRFALFALAVIAPLCTFAQDSETSPTPAPVGENSADALDLAPLGKTVFSKLVSVLPEPVASEADTPCPLENETPICFDPDSVRRSVLQPVAITAAIETRTLTLQIIDGYITFVAAVGAGAVELSEEQISSLRRALDGVGAYGEILKIAKGIVGAVVPVPQALTEAGFEVIGELITRIGKSKNTAERSDALLASAAVIEGLIANLIAETPQIYKIYRQAQNDKLITLDDELARAGLPPPASDTEAAADGSVSSPPEGEEALPPPRAAAVIEAEITAIQEDIRAYHQDLRTYVILLDQRSRAIKILVEAAAQKIAEGPDSDTQASDSEVAVERVRRAANLLKILQVIVGNRLN